MPRRELTARETAGETSPGSLLLRGAEVITMDDAERVETMDIRIDGGIITALGRDLSPQGVDEVIAAHGRVAMPGLVQAHVHFCQTLFRGHADELSLLDWLHTRIWPFEGALRPDELYASARLSIAELLLGGTTTVLDMGTVHHTDELFAAASQMGIRYIGGKTIMDQGQGHPAGLRETTTEALTESIRLCERWHGAAGGRLRYAFAPRFVLSCSEEALRSCVDEARRRGALLHTHAAETLEEVDLVRERTGTGAVTHLHNLGFSGRDTLLAHGVWLSAQERAILRETGTRIVHCPSANLKLASGIARVAELLAGGIHVALGADGAPCNNNLDGFVEMRLAALLHKTRGGPAAVGPAAALRMATRNGALALGLRDVGAIKVGCRADIILLDLDKPHVYPANSDVLSRVVYAARSSDVVFVMVDGKPLVRDGKLLDCDLGDILQHADAASRSVVGRVDG